MRMIFYLGGGLRHRDSCPSLMHIYRPISSASIGGIRKLVVQIPRMDVILMGYWMVGHVRTMMSSVMCHSKLNMSKNT